MSHNSDCCKLKTQKKYQQRNGPPYGANEDCCQGKKRLGNDGKYYISTMASNGVYRWKKVSESTKAVPKAQKKAKGVPKAQKKVQKKVQKKAKSTDLLDGFLFASSNSSSPKTKSAKSKTAKIKSASTGKYTDYVTGESGDKYNLVKWEIPSYQKMWKKVSKTNLDPHLFWREDYDYLGKSHSFLAQLNNGPFIYRYYGAMIFPNGGEYGCFEKYKGVDDAWDEPDFYDCHDYRCYDFELDEPIIGYWSGRELGDGYLVETSSKIIDVSGDQIYDKNTKQVSDKEIKKFNYFYLKREPGEKVPKLERH